MVAHDRPHLAQRAQPGAQRVADDRMLAHHARLVRIELAVLQQHASGTAILPMSCRKPPRSSAAEIVVVQAERAAELRRVVGQPLAVAVGRGIARLDGGAQAQDDRFGRLELVGVPLQAHQRLDARVQLRRRRTA